MNKTTRNATYQRSAAQAGIPWNINPPPSDERCSICRRHIDELPAFGGAGDPLVGDFSGAKLVKNFREDCPGQIGASWECRDCFVRQGNRWELKQEEQLGRPLSDKERHELRYEWLQSLHEMHLDRQLTAAECEDLRAQLDDWQPAEWKSQEFEPSNGVTVTLTAEEQRTIERLIVDIRPANKG